MSISTTYSSLCRDELCPRCTLKHFLAVLVSPSYCLDLGCASIPEMKWNSLDKRYFLSGQGKCPWKEKRERSQRLPMGIPEKQEWLTSEDNWGQSQKAWLQLWKRRGKRPGAMARKEGSELWSPQRTPSWLKAGIMGRKGVTLKSWLV